MLPVPVTLGGLFEVGPVTDTLAWVSIALFVAAAGVEWYGRRTRTSTESGARTRFATQARYIAAAAWAAFAFFWLNLIPHFAFVQQSYVEGILTVVAVPACLYVGYLLLQGRETLFILSRAVAMMGVLYLPFETIPAITLGGIAVPEPRRVFIEVVAVHTATVIELLGQSPELIESHEGYEAAFLWIYGAEEQPIIINTVLACTGIGSMAIFGGLVAAVRAPLSRKLKALAVSLPVIYVLNIIRTTFINVVYGNQYMQWAPDMVLTAFGAENVYRVSFLLSDRVFAQVFAVVALVGITYLVSRQLPELVIVLEDVLYVLTGEEQHLLETLDLPREPTPQPESLRDQ